MKRVLCLLLLVSALLAPSPPTAQAGGWGVTTLDAWPQNVVAGKPITVTFVIRQHGVHVNTDLAPEFKLRSLSSGETLRVGAKLQSNLRRYIAIIKFPSAGEWTWDVVSFPEQRLPNLMVYETRPTTPTQLDGKTLFVAKGCFMCHPHSAVFGSGQFQDAYGAGSSPSLSPNKWDAEYLRSWLKNPKQVKPQTQMPNLGLRDPEIETLVTFLTAKPKP